MHRTLSSIVQKGSSSIRLSDVFASGKYPVFGASGLIGYLDTFQTDVESVAVIKDGAGVGRSQIIPPYSSVLGTIQLIKPNAGIKASYIKYLIDSMRLGNTYTGATIPHIYFKDYGEKRIPNHSEFERRNICKVLDSIVEETNSLQHQVCFLDEQIKSLFNELKRSHLSDSPTLALEDVCSYVVDCPHTTPKYDEEQLVYPCIRTSEIGIGTISWETMKYVGEREYRERIARLQPKKGDIVFGREGTIGHAAILPEDNRFCLGQRTMIMRCKENKCLPEFLLAQLLSDEIKELLLRRNVASTVAHVNVKEVRQIPIFCPPIDVQKAFANQLQQIDKLRFIQLIFCSYNLFLG